MLQKTSPCFIAPPGAPNLLAAWHCSADPDGPSPAGARPRLSGGKLMTKGRTFECRDLPNLPTGLERSPSVDQKRGHPAVPGLTEGSNPLILRREIGVSSG